MYKIYADNTLIYDSTIDEYKIGKGVITLEVNKSGSFEFSVYPDHFYYDQFVKMKTVITVKKDNRIIFRGRILNDVTDYWNNKVIKCEGELGFLNDSIIRPFEFTGTPEDLFKKFVDEHNAQVDNFKKFNIGTVTVIDPNNYINRSNTDYESAMSNLNSRLIEDSLGGYFYVTHEDNEDIPTLNYLADFEHVATQTIEFGQNLKDYTKTTNAGEIATAIIPLGATVNDKKLTIADVNGGKDYVYNKSAVSLRGWIFKTVEWNDVTKASNLKSKAEAYLNNIINQNITIELNAIDLHLLDKTIESFNVCDFIRVISAPHGFDDTLLCTKQSIDLLKPGNDAVTLGSTYYSFTELNSKLNSSLSGIKRVQNTVSRVISSVNEVVNKTDQNANDIINLNESLKNLSLTPRDILGYEPSTIKMMLINDYTSYTTSYNHTPVFAGEVAVSGQKGNLTQTTKTLSYGDRTDSSIRGILIGANINAVEIMASVRYLSNSETETSVHTYLYIAPADGSNPYIVGTAVGYYSNVRFTHNINILIDNLNEGDFLFLTTYKGYTSRDIDVIANYHATQMSVIAIG